MKCLNNYVDVFLAGAGGSGTTVRFTHLTTLLSVIGTVKCLRHIKIRIQLYSPLSVFMCLV